MLCNKDLPLQTLVVRLKERFSHYPYSYLFGREGRKEGKEGKKEMSLKERRRQKGESGPEVEQKIMEVEEELSEMLIGEAFERYKSGEELLVMVLCSKPLLCPKSVDGRWK